MAQTGKGYNMLFLDYRFPYRCFLLIEKGQPTAVTRMYEAHNYQLPLPHSIIWTHVYHPTTLTPEKHT